MGTRGNDAIPSWSGFNYQGKAMLLKLIEHINTIICNGENIEEYKVNLEQYEDFVIYKNDQPIELYQVKAVLSKSKYADYSEALVKLINHQKKLHSSAKCFLISAKAIINWSDSANIYKSSVYLYQYKSSFVSILDVGSYIKKEIEEILSNINVNTNKADIIYLELCKFIDDCIAKMHSSAKKQRNYNINYSEFFDVIKSASSKIEKNREAYLKESVYDYMNKEILEALKSVCVSNCNINLIDCQQKCPAKEAFIKILELPDLYKYLRIINPSKTGKWEILDYASYASKHDFAAIIFGLFYKSKDWEKVLSDNYTVKFKSQYSNTSNQTILPSIIKFTNEKAIQKTIQSILDNQPIINYLYGNTLTVDSNIPLEGTIEQKRITDEYNNVKKDRSITYLNTDIDFITLLDLSKKLN